MYHKDTNIGILGDGGWGTTLALVLAGKGYSVSLWGAFPDYVEEIRRKRENVKFLPGFKIPENVRPVSDLSDLCRECHTIILAVPSQYMRGVLQKLKKEKIGNKPLVSVTKGIEVKTLKVMSQVVKEELGKTRFCVVSGPTIAREVALKMPVAASVASSDRKLAAQVRELFATDYFYLFESDDVLGVEIGGSVKNVVAIASGIAEGLGLGSNMRAALFARGVAEMARLGVKMGARRETFMGLSGLGDLATTCLSPHSRNRWLGEEIGKGRKLEQILKETQMVVEGVETARSAVALAKKYKVSMSISQAVYDILFRGQEPRKAITAVMQCASHRELD